MRKTDWDWAASRYCRIIREPKVYLDAGLTPAQLQKHLQYVEQVARVDGVDLPSREEIFRDAKEQATVKVQDQ